MYKISDYDYHLPDEMIAQTPVEPRDECKLMAIDKKSGELENKIFKDIIDYLNPGDILVVNNTKVIPARIYGQKTTGAKVEILLMEKTEEDDSWKCLVKPGSKIKKSNEIIFSEKLRGLITHHNDDGSRIIKFVGDNIWDEINRIGETPLPPYITNKIDDDSKYQTKYAKKDGAVAAPTAGLHFTEELLEKIRNKGIEIEEVTLHVGLGTFRPIDVEDIRDHEIHEEYYEIKKETYDKIKKAKRDGKNIIAVGTTVVRTLESVVRNDILMGKTNIYIYPPYEFKMIDILITNFHLPKSSLLLLVSAFSNKDIIMNAYEKAKENNYRFFSFGDAMILK
ncbi:MAG: tRNA preQ1(34) S-adenosylmethionine ribosyltransferase-isomerase QueA [Thermotogota bacterium]